VGLLALYAPTYFDLATGPWQAEDARHGPLIALVAAWLFWQSRVDAVQRRCDRLLAAPRPSVTAHAAFMLAATAAGLVVLLFFVV